MTLIRGGSVPMSPADPDPAALGARMAHAARAWHSSLTGSQQQAVLWPFEAAERGNWHYAPRRRHGLALKDMDENQRRCAYSLLASALSPRGNTKARAIMALESVLGELEQGRRGGPLRTRSTTPSPSSARRRSRPGAGGWRGIIWCST